MTDERRRRDIEREIADHLALEAEERRGDGLTDDEARHAAARAFGNRTRISEDVRDVWAIRWLDSLRLDVRQALRSMRRAPSVSAIAIGSAAIGVGACSIVFAIVNAALFTPLPVEDPARLLSLAEIDRRTGDTSTVLSYPDFLDLRAARVFEGAAACGSLQTASIEADGEPQRHWGALVTANYFAVVQPRFAAGRGFDPSRDDLPGEPPVVVLSHRLWQTRFGGAPDIVGRRIAINRRSATVIGVTAAGFRGTELGMVTEFWIPFSMLDEVESRIGRVSQNRRRYWLTAVARLRTDVDVRSAHAELNVIAGRLNAASGRGEQDRGFHLERAGQIEPTYRGRSVTLLSLASAVSLLVLLTACANVANLLLGRASSRAREIAARMALGASRARLVRQLLAESLLLALLGGAGGWLLARYVTSLLGLLKTPLGWPVDLSVALDARVLFFCAALSMATAVAFGLVPAMRATRPDLIAMLKTDASAADRFKRFGLRGGLVTLQVAICTMLLVCMGLFMRSLDASYRADIGLRPEGLLLLGFDPGLDHRPDAQSQTMLRNILDRASEIPGVESATLTTAVPLTFIISNSRFVPAERAADKSAQRVRTDIYGIGPRFFQTLGIPFAAGDDFGFGRPATGRIAIVNEAFARAAFPNEPAIGRRILGDGKALDIVGVVASAKSRTIGEDPRPIVYLPILTDYAAAEWPRGVTLVVKANDAITHAPAIRDAIRAVDPALAVFDVRTMERHVDDALIVPRVTWMLSSVAGGVGLVLATIGVYGVVSFAVARRRREFGIRLAVGARPSEILMLVAKQGAMLVLLGTALGVAAAFGAARFAASLLYGVGPADPVTFVAAPLFLVGVGVFAGLLPARAASRLDPVAVLRTN
ncbi:MAG TPA: ABC transporter permease [Vicinamibacterales bacterium]|jgi:predicted permease